MNLLIIGGGASGLCAAVTAGNMLNRPRITILEANERVGKKLILTGNGRCNITNFNLDRTHYHGGDIGDMFGNTEILNFFSSIGTEIIFESDGRAYPASYQASSVLDNLRIECEKLGVEVLTGQKVTSVIFGNGRFEVKAADSFSANAVILCCGSPAGGKFASDSGYALLRSFGHKINPIFPAIVPIKTETSLTRKLKGIKIKAGVLLRDGSTVIDRDCGEVLFCDYGLSGPPILQISRHVSKNRDLTVSLDLFPEIDYESLKAKLAARSEKLNTRTAENFFTGLINKKVGQTVCSLCGCSLQMSAEKLPADRLAGLCKSLDFKVTGVMPVSEAQATAGGAEISQFDENFMSKLQPGLYACGEILDVVGDCGGYNLAFAWHSGMKASAAAVKRLNGINGN